MPADHGRSQHGPNRSGNGDLAHADAEYPAEDWPRFIERDTQRTNLLDTDGRPTSYEAQLRHAPADIAAQIAPARMRARHAVEGAMARLGEYLRDAKLDALIVVGDDQDELYHRDNMPGILVYYGETIPTCRWRRFKDPDWGWRATARWHEEKAPRDYPVDAALARHLIEALIDREFDIAASNRVPDGRGRGPRDRLCPQADDAGNRADRAGMHQHLLPAEPADPAALL